MLPYLGDINNVPSGWELVSFPEEELVKSDNTAFNIGGSDDLGSDYTNYSGRHKGSSGTAFSGVAASTNTDTGLIKGWWHADITVPDHRHTTTFEGKPQIIRLPFIRALEDMTVLPQGAGMLFDTAQPGSSPIGSGRYIGVSNSDISELDATVQLTDISQSGEHSHHYNSTGYTSGNVISTRWPSNTSGLHGHSLQELNIESVDLSRVSLSLREASDSDQVPDGMLAFYGLGDLPSYWALCNGDNGTSDYVGKFLSINDDAVGEVSGDNTFHLTGKTNSVGHHHLSTTVNAAINTCYHSSNVYHSHNLDVVLNTDPQHVTLKLIKLTRNILTGEADD